MKTVNTNTTPRAIEDLTREEIIQLKQCMILERMDISPKTYTWQQMDEADSLITDDEVYHEFFDMTFTADEFI